METILKKNTPLRLATRQDMHEINSGALLKRGDDQGIAPDGFSYIENQDKPAPVEGYRWARLLTSDLYGWEQVALPTPEPVIQPVTKLTIKRRLDTLGKWQLFKAILAADENMGDEWAIAQDIRSDDPMFVLNKAALKLALDLTDEEFEALLEPSND